MSSTFPTEAAEKALIAAEKAGVARSALLTAAGIAPGAATIAYPALCALYENAAQLTGDAAFGLHVGEQSSAEMYGRLGYLAAHSRDLGEALGEIEKFQRLWSSAAGIEVRRGRARVALRYWRRDALPAERRRQESEQMLATLATFLEDAAGAAARPVAVRFEHRAPADASEHRRLFGVRVSFVAAHTELVLAASALASPLPRADARLAALIREDAEVALARQLGREPFLAELRNSLADGRTPSLRGAAGALGIGARTLQRRLKARRSSFRAVTCEARMDAAKALLDDPRLAIAQISHRLGFSQPSAFHRAFRRAVGTTPRAYRMSLRTLE